MLVADLARAGDAGTGVGAVAGRFVAGVGGRPVRSGLVARRVVGVRLCPAALDRPA